MGSFIIWFSRWYKGVIFGLAGFGVAMLVVLAMQHVDGAAVAGATAGPIPTYSDATPGATCGPGDEHLARTAAALKSGTPVRLAVLGDSTRDETAAAPALYAELRKRLPGADVKSFGQNGASVAAYVVNTELQDQIRAYKPTMIELSIGINDLRQGGSTGDQLTSRLTDYVEGLHADLPNTDILITVPAALSATNVGDADLIKGSDGSVNPDGMAETMTKQLRTAFTTTAGSEDYAALLDVQDAITGMSADTSTKPKYLRDQIHPTDDIARRIADLITGKIGVGC